MSYTNYLENKVKSLGLELEVLLAKEEESKRVKELRVLLRRAEKRLAREQKKIKGVNKGEYENSLKTIREVTE